MGPLASLFAQLYDKERPRRVDALRAKLSAGDDMGPIMLDDEHPSKMADALPFLLRQFDRPEGIKGSRPYRDPGQMGPSPPGPFSAVLGGKR